MQNRLEPFCVGADRFPIHTMSRNRSMQNRFGTVLEPFCVGTDRFPIHTMSRNRSMQNRFGTVLRRCG